MGMRGSASPFGVGEQGAIVYNKILEVDGRTMAHFFIFEAVIIMSVDPDDVGWFVDSAVKSICILMYELIHKKNSKSKKSGIEDLSRNSYDGLDPLLLFPSLSWPSSASRIPSRCRLRVYSMMNGS